jgi:hypothetical protein
MEAIKEYALGIKSERSSDASQTIGWEIVAKSMAINLMSCFLVNMAVLNQCKS